MATKTIMSCDICGSTDEVKHRILDVIFVTDQTEGRTVAPHLVGGEQVDLCARCLNHLLKGNYIFAHGAQGHNEYFFKNKKES